jgi:hypothetical protein
MRFLLQSRMATLLAYPDPVYEECDPNEDSVLSLLESLLEQPIDIVAHGPRAQDVSRRTRTSDPAPTNPRPTVPSPSGRWPG